mgnify:CR=1 FL=1
MITAVTTFGRSGHVTYGRQMMESFSQHWPMRDHLVVYVEEKEDVYQRPPGVFMKNLFLEDPACAQFAIHNGTQDRAWRGGEYNYRFDAVRFCYKVFAFCNAIEHCDTEYCVWLDGDTVTHTRIPEYWIPSLFKTGSIVCLHRGAKPVETGFIAVRITKATKEFFRDYRMLYVNNAIFGLKEWHDGFVFRFMLEQTDIPFTNLAPPGSGHPFVNSELGKYMDHMKGDRKRLGRTPAAEAPLQQREGYWR